MSSCRDGCPKPSTVRCRCKSFDNSLFMWNLHNMSTATQEQQLTRSRSSCLITAKVIIVNIIWTRQPLPPEQWYPRARFSSSTSHHFHCDIATVTAASAASIVRSNHSCLSYIPFTQSANHEPQVQTRPLSHRRSPNSPLEIISAEEITTRRISRRILL